MAITVLDGSGRQLGVDNTSAPVNNKKYFNKATESILGQIARNVYKPVSSTISKGLGLPGDVYSGLSSLINYISQTTNPYLSVGGQEAGGLPEIPQALTSQGMQESITKPLGESLFGVGSQEPQPGFLEGSISKASEYVPYVLGGAAMSGLKGAGSLKSLLGGLGINVAQGVVGEGIKSLGGGAGLQLAGELATGVAVPVVGRLTGSRTDRAILKTANRLKGQEKKAWDLVNSKAIEAGDIGAANFETALLSAEKKLEKSVLPKNRKGASDLLNESFNLINIDRVSIDNLVNTRQKINDGLRTIKSGNARFVLGGVKRTIDEELGKYLGNIHKDAVDLTRTIKSSDLFTNVLRGANKNLDSSNYKWVKNAVADLIPFAASASLYAHPKVLVGALGAYLGKQVLTNIKKVLGDPTMKKEAFKALRKIGASNVLPAALETSKLAVKKSEAQKSSGITVL